MLVQDKLQETHETTATTSGEAPSPASGTARSTHRPVRWVAALAVTGALVGAATIAVTFRDDDTTSTGVVSDGSFEVAEAARMAALGGVVSDGSFEVAEAARMAALRALVWRGAMRTGHP